MWLPAGQDITFDESVFDQASQCFHNLGAFYVQPSPGAVLRHKGQDYLIDVFIIVANITQNKQPHELTPVHAPISAR